jgi:hypothetical protein
MPISERRRTQRARLIQAITGQTNEGMSLRLRDISLEAFGIETMDPLPVGTEHAVSLTMRDGTTLRLVGRVKRCEKGRVPGSPMRYVVGFEYIWRDPSERATAETRIKKLVRSRS